MKRTLSAKKRNHHLRNVAAVHELFGDLGELYSALDPLTIAAVSSEYFAEMDGDERVRLLIGQSQIIQGLASAFILLKEDIHHYRKKSRPEKY